MLWTLLTLIVQLDKNGCCDMLKADWRCVRKLYDDPV